MPAALPSTAPPPVPAPSAFPLSGTATPGRLLLLMAAFAAVYLPFDWVTFIHQRPSLNITPWNPPAGLYMALLLWTGLRGAPAVFVTLVLADLVVRGHPASVASLLLSNLFIVVGYTAAAAVLRRHAAIDPGLAHLRDVAWLLGVTVLGAAVVAVLFVGTFVAEGVFAPAALPSLAFQYWLGDAIGIAVVTPVLLVHINPPLRPPFRPLLSHGPLRRPGPAVLLQALAVAAAAAAVFAAIPGGEFNLFYLLFLPLVWIAVAHGLPGATLAALAIQAALIAGLQATGYPLGTIVYYQTLMLTLAITALFLGSVVSERRRVEARLRDQQNQLAHIARLTATGEMASALAHELNQPLLAAISYTRAAQGVLGEAGAPARAQDLMNKAVAQAERAGEVIRGLRTFLGKGPPRLEPVSVVGIADDTVALARAAASYAGVRLRVEVEPGLPPILADRIQIQQVLLNLVHNGIEAIAAASPPTREVALRIGREAAGQVLFQVRDSGPGVPDHMVDRLYSPFATTKPAGMGLGLPICRSIIEAHGGRLWLADSSGRGACFHVTVPAAKSDD